MPARTRGVSTSTATEPLEPERNENGLRRLRFNEPLSWRVGKSAIPVADLLDRLQTLAQELRKMEQEEIDKESFRKVSQELTNGHLLAHRDKGVRAWTASCIVDILRLCAPDAPFTANQLKDIFTCIVTSVIPSIADPANAYNAQHIYVLNSLAEVKSIVLLTDLDSPDALILPLFTSCFDIVSGSTKSSTGEQVAKNVEYDMTRMLETIIDESPTLAPEVVDIIIAQFLRVDPHAHIANKGKKTDAPPVEANQDTLLLKQYPPAYNMAQAICLACSEKMTSHISQYFNNVIIDSSAPTSSNDPSKSAGNRRLSLDESDNEGVEDIKELTKAHRLIRELWRACPDVLQNVIPQLEAELSTESVPLRHLATETIGNLAAGVGVAGPPPNPPMEPGAYPPVTLNSYSNTVPQPNVLQAALSPKPFAQAHSSAYESFLSRRQDKSPTVRAAWVTAIGRILYTSAGGCGLSEVEEQSLIKSLANMLRDADERVRAASVNVVAAFGFSDIITKLATTGGVSSPDSILAIVAERVKDRRPHVRDRAMRILARIWGVAAGELEDGNEQVVTLLKDIPSKIFDAYYTNDQDIHALLDRVLFEYLLPLAYPPLKGKLPKPDSSQSQRLRSSQINQKDLEGVADKIRVLRILTLVRGLDEKAKKVFFALQTRQLSMRNAMTIFLQTCEEYNGGVMEKDEERIMAQLARVIDTLSKMMPESSRVAADLWKFAKAHDRRNYQLIRFAMAATSDYRTVTKAIKELAKRLQGNSNFITVLDTMTPFLYRCSSLVFNRSHIPAIMEISRTDEKGFGSTAQEMLKEISSRNPEVLEAQIQEMCKDLESQAPTAKSSDDTNSEEILKACSGFAKRLPSKLPKERRFLQALSNYAIYSSSPRAAKHAVSIIMAVADKKAMYAKDLISKSVKDWKYGSEHFLTRLATIAQLNLLATQETDDESDSIVSIAMNQILLANRSKEPGSSYMWSDEMDEETKAKELALKIIVNRLRAKGSADGDDDFRVHAEPVYNTLNQLVSGEGEISKKKDTPATQKPRLRLQAAKSLIKLSAARSVCDQLFTAKDFNALALVAQDPLLQVRSGFINLLRKKLVQKTHLSVRWYTIPFLLAFEPSSSLKESTQTWLRSRAAYFAINRKNDQQTVMESVFSRLLSLLAYHPDYPTTVGNEEAQIADLVDFSRYILFYLSAIANENNLSLIFHIAQRVKQTRDGITKSEEITKHVHTLSDLAQATIRRFAEIYSQQHKIGGAGGGSTNILQTYPGKMRLPSTLFAAMASHDEAQEVADKNFLPEDIEDTLDRIVRAWMRPKIASQNAANQSRKRKSEQVEKNGNGMSGLAVNKKARKEKSLTVRKFSDAGIAKIPKRKRKDEDDWASGAEEGDEEYVSPGARRRSGRNLRKGISYADRDSDEDDLEMKKWDEDREHEAEMTEGEDVDGGSDGKTDHEEDNEDEEIQNEEPEIASPSPARVRKTEPSPGAAKSTTTRSKTESLPVRRSTRRG